MRRMVCVMLQNICWIIVFGGALPLVANLEKARLEATKAAIAGMGRQALLDAYAKNLAYFQDLQRKKFPTISPYAMDEGLSQLPITRIPEFTLILDRLEKDGALSKKDISQARELVQEARKTYKLPAKKL